MTLERHNILSMLLKPKKVTCVFRMKCVSVQRQREKAIENSSAMLLCFMAECLKLKKKTEIVVPDTLLSWLTPWHAVDRKNVYLE